MVSTLALSRHCVHSTLMQLVSLMSWSMSDASPLSLAGSCCRTTPSPAQLYRLWAHFPSATPARGRSLVQQHIVICFLAAACAEPLVPRDGTGRGKQLLPISSADLRQIIATTPTNETAEPRAARLNQLVAPRVCLGGLISRLHAHN